MDPTVLLGQCEGDCDSDASCKEGLVCYMRDSKETVPGCSAGGAGDVNKYDYCTAPQEGLTQGDLVNKGKSPTVLLGQCEGDCDSDAHCKDGLVCYQRDNYDLVPGCSAGGAGDVFNQDQCYNPNLLIPKEVDWVAQCYQNRTTNLTSDNLPNCIVTADFGSAKECYKCEEGYTYDEKYNCITLADAETQGVCTSLTGTPAGTDECSQCDSGKGNTCNDGQVLVSDGSCVKVIANCDNQDCDGTCLECLNGQYLAQDANVCVAKIDHCVDQESNGECLNCQAEYIEVADDKCCPEINNCKVYNAAACGVCDQVCDLGETEQNDICHEIIDHCEDYNNDSTCRFCDLEYQVAVDDAQVCVPNAPHCGDIKASEDCATCVAGYTLVSDPALGKDKCVKAIDHCEEYDYTTGECLSCVGTQQLATDDDVCVSPISGCCSYQSNGHCLNCCAGYLGLTNTSCDEDIEQCTNQGCSGACETCEYGYVVADGFSCSPVIPYCQDYSSNGECATCTSGQHTQNGKCTEDKHCDSYNCENTCVKCADGHTLTEQGICTDSTN